MQHEVGDTMLIQIGEIVQIMFYDWVDDWQSKPYTRIRFARIIDTPSGNWCIARYFDNNGACEFTRNITEWFDDKDRPTIVKISQ